jgi:hypothetical protein
VIGVGIVGYGYWGPNLLRNFSEVPGCKVVSVSDLQDSRLAKVRARYMSVKTTTSFSDLITDPQDAVIIAPRSVHPLRSRDAVRFAPGSTSGPKPIATTSDHAQQLPRRGPAAGSSSRDHTFVYGRVRRCASSSRTAGLGHLLLRLGARGCSSTT